MIISKVLLLKHPSRSLFCELGVRDVFAGVAVDGFESPGLLLLIVVGHYTLYNLLLCKKKSRSLYLLCYDSFPWRRFISHAASEHFLASEGNVDAAAWRVTCTVLFIVSQQFLRLVGALRWVFCCEGRVHAP